MSSRYFTLTKELGDVIIILRLQTPYSIMKIDHNIIQ